MENSCKKYEELFIQNDEQALLEHIKICNECRLEHEKMNKVSSLIKEVSFTIRRKNASKKKMTAIAASFLVIFLAFFAIQFSNPNSYTNNLIASAMDEYSYEEMGLPVDEYGLIMVDFGE